jgi:hypothetical protein
MYLWLTGAGAGGNQTMCMQWIWIPNKVVSNIFIPIYLWVQGYQDRDLE